MLKYYVNVLDNLYLILYAVWCAEFQIGIDADVVCDAGNYKNAMFDQLSDAKVYCINHSECIGIARHLNGTYTPGCRSMISSDTVYWMDMNVCDIGILEQFVFVVRTMCNRNAKKIF